MSRLINADDVKKRGDCYPPEFRSVLSNILSHTKTIKDVVPVRHGRWVKVSGYITPGGDPLWKCSECGKGLHLYGIEHGSYGSDVADSQWVACPNCGAVMSEASV